MFLPKAQIPSINSAESPLSLNDINRDNAVVFVSVAGPQASTGYAGTLDFNGTGIQLVIRGPAQQYFRIPENCTSLQFSGTGASAYLGEWVGGFRITGESRLI